MMRAWSVLKLNFLLHNVPNLGSGEEGEGGEWWGEGVVQQEEYDSWCDSWRTVMMRAWSVLKLTVLSHNVPNLGSGEEGEGGEGRGEGAQEECDSWRTVMMIAGSVLKLNILLHNVPNLGSGKEGEGGEWWGEGAVQQEERDSWSIRGQACTL